MTENKGDLISREALIKWIDDSVSQYGHVYSTDMLNMWGLFKDYLINNAPTVDAIPTELHEKILDKVEGELLECQSNLRPQGKWKHIIEEDNDVECPFCGFQEDGIYYNYCPQCGADMRGDAE